MLTQERIRNSTLPQDQKDFYIENFKWMNQKKRYELEEIIEQEEIKSEEKYVEKLKELEAILS